MIPLHAVLVVVSRALRSANLPVTLFLDPRGVGRTGDEALLTAGPGHLRVTTFGRVRV